MAVWASSFTTSICLILVASRLSPASGNIEGNALNALKNNLVDPNNVLQSWDSTNASHCRWFHVTCKSDYSVTRVELYANNLSGQVPNELGNLTELVSLDLYLNNLSGPIPKSLGNLQKLRFLRLNNNSLSGNIPLSLTTIPALQVLDLSNNRLTGVIPVNGSFSLFNNTSFANNDLVFPPPAPPPPLPPSPQSTSRVGNNAGAIAGVAAGAVVLFAASVIALAYWRQRKLPDRFIDVPEDAGFNGEDPTMIQSQGGTQNPEGEQFYAEENAEMGAEPEYAWDPYQT